MRTKETNKILKMECPICKSLLRVERIDEGVIIYGISRKGNVKEIGNNSNGSTRIYCSKNSNHVIPSDTQEEVLDLIYEAEI